jgi:hypothetical protein
VPPTGVTDSVAAYLTEAPPSAASGDVTKGGHHSPNLVVVKGTRLEVYAVRRPRRHPALAAGVDRAGKPGGPASHPLPGSSREASQSSSTFLELLAELPLYGTVESIAVLPGSGRRGGGVAGTSNGRRDALVLAFR